MTLEEKAIFESINSILGTAESLKIINEFKDKLKKEGFENEEMKFIEDILKEFADISIYLKTCNETKINEAHKILEAQKNPIKKVVNFYKKVQRRLLKWYINPITHQQTIYNSATTDASISFLKSLFLIIENQVTLQKRINELEEKVNKLEEGNK